MCIHSLLASIKQSRVRVVVLDTNDRYLRKITVGQSDTEKGHTRETQVCSQALLSCTMMSRPTPV